MIAKHAIIIGGSIAGLMTARVLSEQFERVTILDRDRLPNGPQERDGTPQGKHVHNLLVRGLRIMDELFPGFEADLEAHGAPLLNYGRDVRMLLTYDNWMPNIKTDYAGRAASRALVEWLLRKRIMALPNVEICVRVIAEDLLLDAHKKRVTGVRVAPRGTGNAYDLQADFVVDCSGRRSKTPQWLEALGLPTPDTSVVDSHVGYASRIYRKPEGFDKWTVLYMPARLPSIRGGAIFEVEDNIWMVMLGGYNRDYPPTDETGYLEYAQSLPQPDIYEAIKEAEPLTKVISYRNTRNIRYHYERIDLPSHFALLGDAVCGFNPIYGQGMTAAAMAAELLRDTLTGVEGDLDGITEVFQQRLKAMHDDIWLLSTSDDLAFISLDPDADAGDSQSNATRFDRFLQQYVGYVVATAPYNPNIVQSMFEIANLTMKPTALFHPRIATSVLWHQMIRPRLGIPAPVQTTTS